MEADIASTEVALNRNLQELELTQGAYDDRCEELAAVERDLQDQVRIISSPNLQPKDIYFACIRRRSSSAPRKPVR